MHKDLALCWQVEEACQLAWPARHTQRFNGYVLAHTAPNTTRRANSVNPLNGPRLAMTETVTILENIFDHFGQSYCFRVPEIADEIDPILTGLGYQFEGGTLTFLRESLEDVGAEPQVTITPQSAPSAWLDFYFSQTDDNAAQRQTFTDILATIAFPHAYAYLEIKGQVGAIAYAVNINGIAIIEAVLTHPDMRNQGLARQIVSALLNWSNQAGADRAALQVVEQNDPARHLYQKLGFTTELYRYHYRTRLKL
jgi:GNAT superfamily N-acetyltransferase